MSGRLAGHAVDALSYTDGGERGYVILCRCKWRSGIFASPSNAQIRRVFERHKAEVRATQHHRGMSE